MAWKPPRVSVCVPVRNGEKCLADCIESILAQTLTDFELIISDNASTDTTEFICRRYALQDPRIRYVRHEFLLAPAENFNSGFELACGQYFLWQAQDDCLMPEFLSKCVAQLDADPSVVMAIPQTMLVDESGRHIEPVDRHVDLDVDGASRRFRRLLMANDWRHWTFELFGLVRWSALRETPLLESYCHGDRVLISRLCVRGKLRRIPGYLFQALRQPLPPPQEEVDDGLRSRFMRKLGPGPQPPADWWDPDLKGRIVFPEWNLLRQYWRSAWETPPNLWQRVACHLVVMEWAARRAPRLARDLAVAAETIRLRILAPLRRFRRRRSTSLESRGSPETIA